MEEITWDDDDVNAHSKFALQRADKYHDLARWACQLAERSKSRLDFSRFRRMQAGYLEQEDAARTIACFMWSS